MKIGILEDDQAICDLLQETLERFGHITTVYRNGSDFLAQIIPAEATPAAKPFDAVCIDLRLPPGVSGEDALRYTRLFYPDLLIVIISAVDPGNLEFIAEKFPGVKTFSKPFHLPDLLATLEAA